MGVVCRPEHLFAVRADAQKRIWFEKALLDFSEQGLAFIFLFWDNEPLAHRDRPLTGFGGFFLKKCGQSFVDKKQNVLHLSKLFKQSHGWATVARFLSSQFFPEAMWKAVWLDFVVNLPSGF